MGNIGVRLKGERLRIGLSQDEFAAIGGVLRNTQSAYENGSRSPDANYLAAVAQLGVDVLYVVTGSASVVVENRLSPPAVTADLSEEIRNLIQSFDSLNEAGKASMQAFVSSCLSTPALTLSGTPKRAKRLTENRRASLDERTNQNIDRALELVKLAKNERAAQSIGTEDVSPISNVSPQRAKRGVEKRRADLGQHAADVVDRAMASRKPKDNGAPPTKDQ